MSGEGRPPDRRTQRTRRAITAAFVQLLGERRYESISVADIVERADLGRSTFYEHFRGKDDLFNQSMGWLLAALADAAAGPAEEGERLAFVVGHLWENRRLARVLLEQQRGAAARRSLAGLIGERLAAGGAAGPVKARSIQIAAAQMALIEAWLTGELAATAEEVAERLRAAGSC